MEADEYNVYGFVHDEVAHLRGVCEDLQETVEELMEGNVRLVGEIEKLKAQSRDFKQLLILKGFGDEVR